MRSPYGGVFERRAISTWLARNGSICPLTGQPLVEAELADALDIKEEVGTFLNEWFGGGGGGGVVVVVKDGACRFFFGRNLARCVGLGVSRA